ncbi:hypothetical protein OIDMADRAFT_94751, partial [Oidiodendron maius Zn]
YEPTTEDSYYTRFTVDKNPCNVEILDTGGSELFQEVRPQWIQNCGGLVFVYDICEVSSFDLIQQQLCDAQRLLSNLHRQSPTAPVIPIALVGNKTDKWAARQVLEEEGHLLADEYEAIFLETSAQYAQGVEELFIRLLRKMRAIR